MEFDAKAYKEIPFIKNWFEYCPITTYYMTPANAIHSPITHLGLQLRENLLAGSQHRGGLAGDHDGEAVVLGLTDLHIASSTLDDFTDNLGLTGLAAATKGEIVVVEATLFNGNMKYLGGRPAFINSVLPKDALGHTF